MQIPQTLHSSCACREPSIPCSQGLLFVEFCTMTGSFLRCWIPAASRFLYCNQVKVSFNTQGCTLSCKQLFVIVCEWWKLCTHEISHASLPCSQSLSALASCGWFLRWCFSAAGSECCLISVNTTILQNLRHGVLHTEVGQLIARH